MKIIRENSAIFAGLSRIRARYDARYDKVQRFPKHSEECKAVAEVPDQQSLPKQITGFLRNPENYDEFDKRQVTGKSLTLFRFDVKSLRYFSTLYELILRFPSI